MSQASRTYGVQAPRSGFCSVLVLFLCFAGQADASKKADDIKQGSFSAPVTVAADGHAELGQIEGVSGPLADAVRSDLVTRRFIPAQRDGVRVSSTSRLTGTAVLTPIDADEYAIRLQDVAVAPTPLLLKAEPPRFPPQMFKDGVSATVELALLVGTDGKIKEARTVYASDRKFDAAVREVLPRWRFERAATPEATDVTVTVPVWFLTYSGKKTPPPPKFECKIDPRVARIEGQNGCLDMIVVTASRVRSTSTSMP